MLILRQSTGNNAGKNDKIGDVFSNVEILEVLTEDDSVRSAR
jgi:hypothetical protein